MKKRLHFGTFKLKWRPSSLTCLFKWRPLHLSIVYTNVYPFHGKVPFGWWNWAGHFSSRPLCRSMIQTICTIFTHLVDYLEWLLEKDKNGNAGVNLNDEHGTWFIWLFLVGRVDIFSRMTSTCLSTMPPYGACWNWLLCAGMNQSWNSITLAGRCSVAKL